MAAGIPSGAKVELNDYKMDNSRSNLIPKPLTTQLRSQWLPTSFPANSRSSLLSKAIPLSVSISQHQHSRASTSTHVSKLYGSFSSSSRMQGSPHRLQWVARKEGPDTYRLSVGGYHYTGIIDKTVTASIHQDHNVEWRATYRKHQDAYT